MNIELNTLSLVNNSGILRNVMIYNYIFFLIPIFRIINLQRRLFKFINFFFAYASDISLFILSNSLTQI
jgi:hypothetical protein